MEKVNINIVESLQKVQIAVKEDGRHLPHGGYVGTAMDLYNLLRSADPAKNERVVITSEILALKYFTLSQSVIDNQSIRVFIENIGIKAEVGVDFSYSGNDIYWTSFEFEDKLEVGDILHVFYY